MREHIDAGSREVWQAHLHIETAVLHPMVNIKVSATFPLAV
jgi:hypothetical protein